MILSTPLSKPMDASSVKTLVGIERVKLYDGTVSGVTGKNTAVTMADNLSNYDILIFKIDLSSSYVDNAYLRYVENGNYQSIAYWNRSSDTVDHAIAVKMCDGKYVLSTGNLISGLSFSFDTNKLYVQSVGGNSGASYDHDVAVYGIKLGV